MQRLPDIPRSGSGRAGLRAPSPVLCLVSHIVPPLRRMEVKGTELPNEQRRPQHEPSALPLPRCLHHQRKQKASEVGAALLSTGEQDPVLGQLSPMQDQESTGRLSGSNGG